MLAALLYTVRTDTSSPWLLAHLQTVSTENFWQGCSGPSLQWQELEDVMQLTDRFGTVSMLVVSSLWPSEICIKSWRSQDHRNEARRLISKVCNLLSLRKEQHSTNQGSCLKLRTCRWGTYWSRPWNEVGSQEDNIKNVLKEVRCDGVDWVSMDQDRGQWGDFVNAIMNLRVV
jgi:hypothetical protein